MLQEKYPLYYTPSLSVHVVFGGRRRGGGKVKDTLREVVTPPAKVRAEGRRGQTKLFYLETTFFGHF